MNNEHFKTVLHFLAKYPGGVPKELFPSIIRDKPLYPQLEKLSESELAEILEGLDLLERIYEGRTYES